MYLVSGGRGLLIFIESYVSLIRVGIGMDNSIKHRIDLLKTFWSSKLGGKPLYKCGSSTSLALVLCKHAALSADKMSLFMIEIDFADTSFCMGREGRRGCNFLSSVDNVVQNSSKSKLYINRNLTRPSISESAVKTEGQPRSCGKKYW